MLTEYRHGDGIRPYRPEMDGVATTFAVFVAGSLDMRDPYQATAQQVEQIKCGHGVWYVPPEELAAMFGDRPVIVEGRP